MNFSLANQLETPITKTVDGIDVEFPRLVMSDLTAWAAAIQNKRLSDAKARIDKDVSPFERQRLLQIVADQDVELGSVVAKAYTPSGVTKALVTSLKKAGRSDADALEILQRIHFKDQVALADDVMSPPRPEADAGTAPVEPKGDGSENPPGDSIGT